MVKPVPAYITHTKTLRDCCLRLAVHRRVTTTCLARAGIYTRPAVQIIITCATGKIIIPGFSKQVVSITLPADRVVSVTSE